MIAMTDVEKRNVVNSIITKSNLKFDLNDNANKYYENIMGSDSFFVLSNKRKNNNEKKDLYVIVDEKYAFVQVTTFVLKDSEEISRLDEIVRFKKVDSNKIYVESASVKQEKNTETDLIDLHSIGEMAKVDKNFDFSTVKTEYMDVPEGFKFTNGFTFNSVENKNKANLIDKFIKYNLNLNNAI